MNRNLRFIKLDLINKLLKVIFNLYKLGLMTMAYKISKTGFILKYMDTWDCRMTKLPFAQGSKK